MATALHAVLFDLDGTLYSRVAALRAFLTAQYAARSALLGALPLGVFIDTFVAYDANGSVRRDVVYPRILGEIGGDPADAPRLVDDYVSGFGVFCRAPDDLFPMLAALRADGLRLGVVTNGETRIQRRTIAGLGLDQAFDAVLISEIEGVRKPDREIFLRALARLGATAEASVFVGDNPEADIAGAKAAGLRAIWIANTYYRPPDDADATARTLAEIPMIVGGW